MTTQPLAEAFPMGDFLAEELEERGWSEADFAAIMGRPTRFVEELISGERELTQESAALVGGSVRHLRRAVAQPPGHVFGVEALAVDKFGGREQPPKITA